MDWVSKLLGIDSKISKILGIVRISKILGIVNQISKILGIVNGIDKLNSKILGMVLWSHNPT